MTAPGADGVVLIHDAHHGAWAWEGEATWSPGGTASRRRAAQTVTAARLGANIIDIDSGHDPMISQPATVASVINLAGKPGQVKS